MLDLVRRRLKPFPGVSFIRANLDLPGTLPEFKAIDCIVMVYSASWFDLPKLIPTLQSWLRKSGTVVVVAVY